MAPRKTRVDREIDKVTAVVSEGIQVRSRISSDIITMLGEARPGGTNFADAEDLDLLRRWVHDYLLPTWQDYATQRRTIENQQVQIKAQATRIEGLQKHNSMLQEQLNKRQDDRLAEQRQQFSKMVSELDAARLDIDKLRLLTRLLGYYWKLTREQALAQAEAVLGTHKDISATIEELDSHDSVSGD